MSTGLAEARRRIGFFSRHGHTGMIGPSYLTESPGLLYLGGLDLTSLQLSNLVNDLSSLEELTALWLSENSLTSTAHLIDTFVRLPWLSRLVLDKNRLQSTPEFAAALAPLLGLSVISIDENQLTSNASLATAISPLRGLWLLSLSENELTSTADFAAAISPLVGLSSLNLYKNRLTSTAHLVKALTPLKQLNDLSLNDNQLTLTSGLWGALSGLSKLKAIRLYGNNFAVPNKGYFTNVAEVMTVLAETPKCDEPIDDLTSISMSKVDPNPDSPLPATASPNESRSISHDTLDVRDQSWRPVVSTLSDRLASLMEVVDDLRQPESPDESMASLTAPDQERVREIERRLMKERNNVWGTKHQAALVRLFVRSARRLAANATGQRPYYRLICCLALAEGQIEVPSPKQFGTLYSRHPQLKDWLLPFLAEKNRIEVSASAIYKGYDAAYRKLDLADSDDEPGKSVVREADR